MLSVANKPIMSSVIMLSVIMLSVIMLSVVAPFPRHALLSTAKEKAQNTWRHYKTFFTTQKAKMVGHTTTKE